MITTYNLYAIAEFTSTGRPKLPKKPTMIVAVASEQELEQAVQQLAQQKNTMVVIQPATSSK